MLVLLVPSRIGKPPVPPTRFTALDIYIEYDFNASGQSITLVDTNGVSVCVNIVTAISHTFTNVDLTGTSPVQITIRSTACGA